MSAADADSESETDFLDDDDGKDHLPPKQDTQANCPRKRRRWKMENIPEALKCCKNKELGIEEASLVYQVPRRTLRSMLKDYKFSLIDGNYKVLLLRDFPSKAELELVEHLQSLIKSQAAYTSIEVRRLAYELVCDKFNQKKLSKRKNCLLGKSWYRAFMTKYPHLETENISFENASEQFYNALEKLVTDNHIDCDRIYCADGIELKFQAIKKHDARKFYRKQRITSISAKALCCINASGSFIPPLFVRPQESESAVTIDQAVVSGAESNKNNDGKISNNGSKSTREGLQEARNGDPSFLPTTEEVGSIETQVREHLNGSLEDAAEGSEAESNEKIIEQLRSRRRRKLSRYECDLNSISHEQFYQWLRDFVSRVKPNHERKIILLVSDQSCMKGLNTLRLAKSEGIIFLVLPPHDEHKFYPLDGFAKSLTSNLSARVTVWLEENRTQKGQEVPLQELFVKAYECIVSPSIAKNGFKYSGVWPINRHIFESNELGGESILLKRKNQSPQPCTATEEGPCSSKRFLANSEDDGMTKSVDFTNLCRVCMKEKMYMKPLFDSGAANYYGKQLSEIIGRAISPNEGLPNFICPYCLVLLMDVIKIKKLYLKSNKKLARLLKENSEDQFVHGENESGDTITLTELQCQDPKEGHENHYETLEEEEKEEDEDDCNVNEMCRICAIDTGLMFPIFSLSSGINDGPDLSVRVADVVNFQIDEEDGLSPWICACCRSSILQAWNYIQKVLNSDNRFREILSET